MKRYRGSSSLVRPSLMALCLILTQEAPAMQPRTHVSDKTKSGIVFTLPGDAAYRQVTETLLADSASSEERSFLPCSAVATNKSDKNVVALTAVFRVADATGKTEDHVMSFYSLDANPDNIFLRPEESRVISPSSQLTLLHSSQGKGRHPVVLKAGFDAEWCQKQAEVTLVVDSVVFEDGIIVGDDTQGMAAEFNAQLDGAIDTCKAVMASHEANPGQSVVGMLTKYAEMNPEPPGHDPINARSQNVQRAYAQSFLHYLNDHSEQELVTDLIPKLLAAPHVPRIHRTTNQ